MNAQLASPLAGSVVSTAVNALADLSRLLAAAATVGGFGSPARVLVVTDENHRRRVRPKLLVEGARRSHRQFLRINRTEHGVSVGLRQPQCQYAGIVSNALEPFIEYGLNRGQIRQKPAARNDRRSLASTPSLAFRVRARSRRPQSTGGSAFGSFQDRAARHGLLHELHAALGW
jgi:hypothetical protein